MESQKHSSDFYLHQIKYERKEIEEYRNLSIHYPEYKKIHKGHNNPAWEIVTRQINNQKDLDELPTVLYFK